MSAALGTLPIGTKVQSTESLLYPDAWLEGDGNEQPRGEVVGHLNGFNRVVLHRPDGSVLRPTGYGYWLATDDELEVLPEEENAS